MKGGQTKTLDAILYPITTMAVMAVTTLFPLKSKWNSKLYSSNEKTSKQLIYEFQKVNGLVWTMTLTLQIL